MTTTTERQVWEITWITYEQEVQDGHVLPMDTQTTLLYTQPSLTYLNEMRKLAHEKGYKLLHVTTFQQDDEAADEF